MQNHDFTFAYSPTPQTWQSVDAILADPNCKNAAQALSLLAQTYEPHYGSRDKVKPWSAFARERNSF
jgi:hypothetical protein